MLPPPGRCGGRRLTTWAERILFKTAILRVLLALLGAVAGMALGATVGSSGIGGVLGLATVLAVGGLRDEWRTSRLLNWVRRSPDQPAPSLQGAWGDVAYHVEKALRRRERALEEAQDNHAQFVEAFQATPNGVLLLDERHQILWCNRVAGDHLGLDPQRDRLQLITNLVRQPAFVDYLEHGPHDQPLALNSPRHAGTLSILMRCYAADRALLLVQDISALEQAEAMRRAFVAHVSHEIRTPLTVISGFLETLQSIELPPPERDRIVALMAQQSQRMSDLVADLLVLARLEGSPRPPLDVWVGLAPLMQRIEAEARAISRGRHTLTFDCTASVDVAGQESELHSAIGNLVLNAIRYTPEGGRITVTTAREPEGHLLIRVRDSGIGIAREHIPRLTQRFYRVDPSRSRETGGTGLGLAIVKHAIQRHGGELLIESEPGAGSEFMLRLPGARVREGSA